MASVLVCGGSVIGLATAMLLAGDGHEVLVLERDAALPPDVASQAWAGWERTGVAQFHQAHILLPRFRTILDEELPGTVDALVEAGCVSMNPLYLLPPSVEDGAPRLDDDRFRFVTGRRPVVESVLAHAARRTPGVTVRRGVEVARLTAGPGALDGVPHVTGVVTSEGDLCAADLVVDAMGRRTRLGGLLDAIGGRRPEADAEDCGFVYHTRFFTGPNPPPMVGPPVADLGTFSLLTIPGDNGTWSVTVWAASADPLFKRLREPDRFAAVVAACPLYAHWLDGEPISDVLTMAGVLDRHHRFVVDGRPVATGVAAVGDAWACTNPSAGRGMTVGLLHAQCLRDVVRSDLDAPVGFARAWAETTEVEVGPFYRDQIRADRARMAEMRALRDGEEPPQVGSVAGAMFGAAMRDPEVFRGLLEVTGCLALPDEVFARPGFTERLDAVAGSERPQLPGPDRAELTRLLA